MDWSCLSIKFDRYLHDVIAAHFDFLERGLVFVQAASLSFDGYLAKAYQPEVCIHAFESCIQSEHMAYIGFKHQSQGITSLDLRC